jgi:hypothetical protein
VTALTHELLRERISRLFDQILLELKETDEPVPGVAWEKLRCDRCGAAHNLLGGTPVGWTTSGTFEDGFTDLCRACSG